MGHLPDMGYAYVLGQWTMGVTGDTIKIPFIS
jgi:hypothetical protein